MYRDLFIPRLIIAGPYEFLPDNPFLYGIHTLDKRALPPAESARVALTAYNLLNVDIGWLSKKSAEWLRRNTGDIPRGFVEVGSEPITRLLESTAGTLGFVLFPEGPEPGRSPTPKQIAAVIAAGKSLKDKAVMVVGISPWGYIGERDFLPAAQGVFDCILGSGEGVGFPSAVPQKTPSVLWIRPDGAGRSVNILELFVKPQIGQKIEWIERTTFGASLEFLGNNHPSDPAMLRVVGSPPPKPSPKP